MPFLSLIKKLISSDFCFFGSLYAFILLPPPETFIIMADVKESDLRAVSLSVYAVYTALFIFREVSP
jgi:hypothetical protein